MKAHHILLAFIVLAASPLTASEYGEVKSFHGVELYYTAEIEAAKADELGKYLVDSGFADGKDKTVQITKPADVFQFRMVVKPDLELEGEMSAVFRTFARELSRDVFGGSPVVLHACNDQLKTVKAYEMGDDAKVFNGTSITFGNDFDATLLDKLGNYLVTSGFAAGGSKSVEIVKKDDLYQFRMVVMKGLNLESETGTVLKAFAAELSRNVFDGASVELHACNDAFKTLKVFAP